MLDDASDSVEPREGRVGSGQEGRRIGGSGRLMLGIRAEDPPA